MLFMLCLEVQLNDGPLLINLLILSLQHVLVEIRGN